MVRGHSQHQAGAASLADASGYDLAVATPPPAPLRLDDELAAGCLPAIGAVLFLAVAPVVLSAAAFAALSAVAAAVPPLDDAVDGVWHLLGKRFAAYFVILGAINPPAVLPGVLWWLRPWRPAPTDGRQWSAAAAYGLLSWFAVTAGGAAFGGAVMGIYGA